MRFLFLIILISFSTQSLASQPTPEELLEQSQELLLVTTPDWNALQGKLQVYHRSQPKAPWIKSGGEIPVVIGADGMAWGVDLANKTLPGPVKKEGDGRSPLGVFAISPVFGFDAKPSFPLNADYMPIAPASVCVDDVKSQYYNQIFDAAKIKAPDWDSAEPMRLVSLYRLGAVIRYNMDQPVPGAGSCIFMHIWRTPDKGTAGCVAMEQGQLQKVLQGLDQALKPVMAIVTMPVYEELKTSWDLP